MELSPIAGWSEFFTAAAGAAAGLAGLVFVSLSINLTRILETPLIVGRAAETMLLLAGALGGTLVCLVPHLSALRLGLFLGAVAGPTWALPMLIQWRAFRSGKYFRLSYEVLRAVCFQVAALPGVLAALSLCGLLPGGIGWYAAGVILSFLVAILNAWVLLIEILR
jgi:hypothetical protein